MKATTLRGMCKSRDTVESWVSRWECDEQAKGRYLLRVVAPYVDSNVPRALWTRCALQRDKGLKTGPLHGPARRGSAGRTRAARRSEGSVAVFLG